MRTTTPSSLPLLPGYAAFAAAAAFVVAGMLGMTGCTEITNIYLPDNNEEVMDDSDCPEDTKVDDTDVPEDTDVETDSGTNDTTVEDTGETEPVCEFLVDTWDGEVVMGNTLDRALSSASPMGAAIPGTIEVLRLTFGANNSECQDLAITGMTILGLWTDNAQTDWVPSGIFAVDLTTGENLGDATISQPGTIVYAGFTMNDRIEAGEVHAIAFYADLGGASAVEDDSVRFDLYLDSVGVQDESSERVLRQNGISGNTLVF